MKYYGDIEISDLLLQQLPEDDIPDQLKAMIHMTDNEKIVDKENESYVPSRKMFMLVPMAMVILVCFFS